MKHLLFTFWSYSNGEDLLDMEVDIKFTFHYGPIQIEEELGENDFIAIYIPLWSYSNEQWTRIRLRLCVHLHSTMVLFKSFSSFILTRTLTFTFHYGPIQMQQSQSCICNFRIYIPLWSYSNNSTMSEISHCKSIYIPLWSYSNIALFLHLLRYFHIYIPLWSYSNRSCWEFQR